MNTIPPKVQEDALPTTTQAEQQPAKKRRRFLGAGVAATSTILTIASQPALGATCFTPSRSLSRNTSISQNGEYGQCNGVSPGNYKSQTNPARPSYNWPIAPTTLFHPLFAVGTDASKTRFYKTNGTSMTMLEVLSLSGTQDPYKVAFHIIGAYLNALNGYLDSHITATLIQNIWKSYALNGYYEVVPGTQWSGSDIVAYLQANGIAP